MAADLDTAMVAVGGVVRVEGALRLGVEEQAHVCAKRRPVVLEREQIVGPPGGDRLGNGALAADRIDGDERAGQFEAFEQERNGVNLVALAADGLLSQHQPLAARPGRDQMQRVGLALPCPPRRLAVDGDDVGFAVAQRLHPGGEAVGKQRRRQRVHHVVERVVGGDAVLEGQQPAQKIQLAPPPAFDLDEILRPRKRPAQDQKQDFRQRIDDFPRLPGIIEGGEMVEKRFAGHR